MLSKTLEETDFQLYSTADDKSTLLATFIGESRFLIAGADYVVCKCNTKGKVTVPLSLNKSKLDISNGGVQFAMSSFMIKIPDSSDKRISLNDLSPQDRVTLLQEARELIEQENIKANAVVMYKIKKTELDNTNVDEIIKTYISKLKLTSAFDKDKLKDKVRIKYRDIVHFIYTILYMKCLRSNAHVVIETASDWELYKSIAIEAKNMIIKCQEFA